MKIKFGVVDYPYGVHLSTTTGEVADILERHYHIWQTFVKLHGDLIKEAVGEALRARLENTLMGAPDNNQDLVLPPAMLSKIEERFRTFLDNNEMNGQVPGVPTKASLAGVNHRLKHPYRKGNPPRPSFIDQGDYQLSAKVWVDQ
jgi:hypothetical protein